MNLLVRIAAVVQFVFLMELGDGSDAYGEMMEALKVFFNNYVVSTLFVIATAVFLVLGIINGIRMAKATTDEEKTKAKKALIGQLIGMIVCFASVWLAPLLIELLQTLFANNTPLK